MTDQPPLASPPPTSSYVETHCKICAAGWTRSAENREVVVCLLDREPVWPEITGCNRYTVRED